MAIDQRTSGGELTEQSNRRVLLKLSGEAFADPEVGYGIDPLTVQRVAEEIAEAQTHGVTCPPTRSRMAVTPPDVVSSR
jgi:hypothetical protein